MPIDREIGINPTAGGDGQNRDRKKREDRPSRHADKADEALLSARLQSLPGMGRGALCAEWRRCFRAPPPRRARRDLLMLGIAWKIQERVHGGFSAQTRRRLKGLAHCMATTGDIARNRRSSPKQGAKLVREWNGRTHTVIVHDGEFEWNGRIWRSLTAIARAITGAHWSGPRFFGLNGVGGARGANRGTSDVRVE